MYDAEDRKGSGFRGEMSLRREVKDFLKEEVKYIHERYAKSPSSLTDGEGWRAIQSACSKRFSSAFATTANSISIYLYFRGVHAYVPLGI